MAEAVASSIVGMVFDKLGSRVLDELQSLKGVGEELEKLESTLSAIQSVLEDAEGRPGKDRALVNWLKKLKDVAYDIDDVLDEAAVEKSKVRRLSYLPKQLQFRHEIAKKINEISKRLDEISEEKSRFHLQEGAPKHSHEVNFLPRETVSYVEKSQVFGRDEDKKGIIDFLLNKCNEKNLGVISIVGLGGLGKTTLAQLVYNDDEQVSQHFGTNKGWVYVSEKFDIKNVIRSVIESLTKEKFEPLSMDLMVQKLLEQIKGKRFLLVLDDVWNEDYGKWETLGSLLENGAKGSKVIVTTRSTRVASVMKSDELHSLGGLLDDDCWTLFESNAFESDDDRANNRNFLAIGTEIVKKCGGLPLAAKALGSLLRFKREEKQWRELRDNETWTQFKDNKDILPALMLSYNQLSPPLKQCFAYCSIFPRGTKIEIKMLVQLWAAEGFVDSSSGSQYVDELISRSLLGNVTADGDYDSNGFVKMHDMVHNLAQFVTGSECSIVDATSGSSTISISQNSRYTSLLFPNDPTPSITALILSCGQKLRTFHLIRNYYNRQQVEEDICQQVLDTVVSNMKLLRAFHFHGLPVKELPATMKKLVHLRYLDLSFTKLKGLPQTIGLLHNLQTLKLRGTDFETLPTSIGDLVNLLTLDMSNCQSLHSLPSTIGKLIRLKYLGLFQTKLQTLPPTIGNLHNLETLGLFDCEKLKVLPESIGGLANLLTLNLNFCTSLHSLPSTIGKLVRLKYLKLSWTKLQTLPPTIDTLHNLETLDLSHCNKLEVLPESIGDLANLLTLNLQNCLSFHSLPSTIGKLVRLKCLDLSRTKLQTLPPTIGTLHNLETLNLSGCWKLEVLPESIGGLANLLTLNLNYCGNLQSLTDAKNIQSNRSLTNLSIDGCDKLTSMPTGIGHLSQLQELSMYVLGDGENSASLVELGTLMNLKGGLRIKHLQNVKDVAEASAANLRGKQGLTSLGLEWDFDADWKDKNYEGIEDFENESKALMERVAAIDGDRVRLIEDVSGSLQPHQNLQNLQIRGYVGKTLPGWMMGLPATPNLVELQLESFARCDNLQALEQLSCLEVLILKRFPFIECLPRLGQLPRLRVLTLYMLPNVKCLGSELYGGAFAFLALHILHLQFMLGLEEWSGNPDDGEDDFLSRLSWLELRDCPKLQALPSTTFPSVKELRMNVDDELLVSYLGRGAFPNLIELEVGNCVDTKDESSLPEALVQRLHSIESIRKGKKLIWRNHSDSELEMMRLETQERIATEIEKKLDIKPSS